MPLERGANPERPRWLDPAQILVNLILLIYGSFMYGLQRVCFGQLRPVEIEQLYEKAWFAITETCLAMTIFREEVGGFFGVMFTALVTGKVWGWIGEGRVEVLEQQPPANPRLFHVRMTISLALSLLFDFQFLRFTVATVRRQDRPDMMIMFAFEFAVLTVSTLSTCCRYAISLREAYIMQVQLDARIRERDQAHKAQQDARQQELAAGETLPEETADELDEDLDDDVPGWEDKGRWVFGLELATGACLCLSVLRWGFLTSRQTFASWCSTSPSSASSACSTACPSTSFATWP